MPRPLTRMALALALAACAHPTVATGPSRGVMPFPVDSARSQVIANGVTHTVLHSPQGP